MRFSRLAPLLLLLLLSGCILATSDKPKSDDLVFGMRTMSEVIVDDLPEFASPHVRIVEFRTTFVGNKQVIELDLENAGTDSEFYVDFYRVPIGKHIPLSFVFQSDRFSAPPGWTATHRWEVVLNGTHHVAQVRVYSVSPGSPDHLYWMVDQKYILPE